jgi:hypothetical protein
MMMMMMMMNFNLVKRKIASVQTTKTYRGSGGIAAFNLKIGTRRGMVGFLP